MDEPLTGPVVIVSDLHIGSRHFQAAAFLAFIDALPADASLVLNGDAIDDPGAPISPEHEKFLDRLREESRRRRVVWIYGNHDEDFVLSNAGPIEYRTSCAVGRSLIVTHGHDCDRLMPRHRWFVDLFHRLHRLRVRLGAPAVHVAYYAKKFLLLYWALRRHVAARAALYARERGYEAVTCGHVHYAEDVMVRGVRYINSGCWTEQPCYFVHVDAEGVVALRSFSPPTSEAEKRA